MYSGSSTERQAEEEMVRQHSWRLYGDESRSVRQATQLAEERVKWEEILHCPQQGLLEREDIVIVAKALSKKVS